MAERTLRGMKPRPARLAVRALILDADRRLLLVNAWPEGQSGRLGLTHASDGGGGPDMR